MKWIKSNQNFQIRLCDLDFFSYFVLKVKFWIYIFICFSENYFCKQNLHITLNQLALKIYKIYAHIFIAQFTKPFNIEKNSICHMSWKEKDWPMPTRRDGQLEWKKCGHRFSLALEWPEIHTGTSRLSISSLVVSH